MTDQRKIFAFYNYKRGTYESNETLRTKLTVKDAAKLHNIVKAIRPSKTPNKNYCLSDVMVQFYCVARSAGREFHRLELSNFQFRNTETTLCGNTTGRGADTQLDCLHKMERGECRCKLGQQIGAVLWPEIYAQNKEHTK